MNKYHKRKIYIYIFFSFTVSEAAYAIHCRHLNDKCKYVVYESIQRLVGHLSPRQMCNRLELIVDEQLWRHHNETKR